MLNTQKCRVAIISLENRPYHALMRKLLFREIAAGAPDSYSISFHDLLPSDEGVRTMVHSLIVQKRCDILITVGEICSVNAMEATKQHGNFPMIFVGVGSPGKLGLSGPNITGTTIEEACMEKLAVHLKMFQPRIKKLLIPYHATPGGMSRAPQATELKNHLEVAGMQATVLPVNRDFAHIMESIRKNSDDTQGIVLLEGCYTNTAQEHVALHAWDQYKAFFGSNSCAIDTGATAAFQTDISKLAEHAYKQLCLFNEHKTPLGAIPTRIFPNDREFYVNVDALYKIGFLAKEIEQICATPGVKAVRKWVKPPLK